MVAASEGGPAAPQRRRAAVRSAALSVADRQGAFRRRSGGDGRRRNRARGERRRREDRDRLRRLAGRGRNHCGRAPGCAAGARRRAVECLLRWRAWRRGGDRRRLCPRRPRDPVRDLGAAHHRRADGAARGARRLRRRERPLHRLCRQWRRGAAEERSRHHARRAAGKSPRADAGRRRQFRHPRHDLCRIRGGGVGGEKARPAGEMDHRAPRVVPERLSGARSCRRSRAGARRQGQVPRDARLQSRQSRRPHHQFRHGAKGRADDVEHLPHAGGVFPRPRHLEPHLADAALSQRRPAGSDLRHGAADRSRRARMRLRPRDVAPAQSRDRKGIAVQKSVRRRIRQRRLYRRHGSGAETRRLGKASSAAAPKPRSAASAAASASAIMSISPPACRARKPRSPFRPRVLSN